MNPENGGDLGWQTSMAPALQKVVEEMKKGEIYNGMLNIGTNTFVVKLMDREEGTSGLNSDTRTQIISILTEDVAAKRRKEYLNTLNMKYPVRRYR